MCGFRENGNRRHRRRTARISREGARGRQCCSTRITSAKTTAYKYGVILPYKTLFIWNGIGCRYVRDRIGRCPRQQGHLADREALAELEKSRFGEHVLAGRALAQEIDVQIGGHRKPDRADR